MYLFLAYDRYIKLWDTETGACLNRFTSRKVPYCAKFHPDEDKQHLFVCGTSDKKIICVSYGTMMADRPHSSVVVRAVGCGFYSYSGQRIV